MSFLFAMRYLLSTGDVVGVEETMTLMKVSTSLFVVVVPCYHQAHSHCMVL